MKACGRVNLAVMRSTCFRLLMLLTLFTAPTALRAQDEGISQREQEKILAKKAKEEKKAIAKQEKEGRKLHLGRQDKATRKRMKQNQRRADRSGPGRHRDGFFTRLFSRKR